MRGARRPLVSLVLLLGRSALCGKVLTGEDMRAMGMGDLAGIADGDLSPDSIAALERRGVSTPGIGGAGGAASADGGVRGAEFTPQGGGASAMSMAQLSEQESVGSAVPDSMRCDACHAVAHQLREALLVAEHNGGTQALPEARTIEALEAVCEGTLRPKTLGTGDNYRVVPQDWSVCAPRHRRPCALSFVCGRRGEYCIKELGGVNRLAGPGCPIEDQSGYAQFGMMKTRPTPTSCTVQLQSANEKLVRAGLEKKCFELLGEHDEIAIYEHYRAQRDGDGEGAALHTMLCGRECRTDEERRPKKGKKAKRRDQLRPPPPPPPPPQQQPAAVAKSTESPVAELRRLRGGAFRPFSPEVCKGHWVHGLGHRAAAGTGGRGRAAR